MTTPDPRLIVTRSPPDKRGYVLFRVECRMCHKVLELWETTPEKSKHIEEDMMGPIFAAHTCTTGPHAR